MADDERVPLPTGDVPEPPTGRRLRTPVTVAIVVRREPDHARLTLLDHLAQQPADRLDFPRAPIRAVARRRPVSRCARVYLQRGKAAVWLREQHLRRVKAQQMRRLFRDQRKHPLQVQGARQRLADRIERFSPRRPLRQLRRLLGHARLELVAQFTQRFRLLPGLLQRPLQSPRQQRCQGRHRPIQPRPGCGQERGQGQHGEWRPSHARELVRRRVKPVHFQPGQAADQQRRQCGQAHAGHAVDEQAGGTDRDDKKRRADAGDPTAQGGQGCDQRPHADQQQRRHRRPPHAHQDDQRGQKDCQDKNRQHRPRMAGPARRQGGRRRRQHRQGEGDAGGEHRDKQNGQHAQNEIPAPLPLLGQDLMPRLRVLPLAARSNVAH